MPVLIIENIRPNHTTKLITSRGFGFVAHTSNSANQREVDQHTTCGSAVHSQQTNMKTHEQP